MPSQKDTGLEDKVSVRRHVCFCTVTGLKALFRCALTIYLPLSYSVSSGGWARLPGGRDGLRVRNHSQCVCVCVCSSLSDCTNEVTWASSLSWQQRQMKSLRRINSKILPICHSQHRQSSNLIIPFLLSQNNYHHLGFSPYPPLTGLGSPVVQLYSHSDLSFCCSVRVL